MQNKLNEADLFKTQHVNDCIFSQIAVIFFALNNQIFVLKKQGSVLSVLKVLYQGTTLEGSSVVQEY
ncbi:hypothetical protein DF947_14740 [Pedobacter paludis]|uniref:Uncharacterized protein n=1 Tax=Pedobacter paludis TaxID=2203212 RepID=A0A317EWE3_9SPHI|nr:hypothetical protein DF947_14740 [Pedobacter paludis]